VPPAAAAAAGGGGMQAAGVQQGQAQGPGGQSARPKGRARPAVPPFNTTKHAQV
jgi:hypothetical protein